MKFPVIASFVLSCLTLHAQGEEKEKEKERTCRIIYLQRPGDAPEEAYLFDGTSSHKVLLSGMNFSEVVKLPAGDLVLGMTPGQVLTPEDFPEGAPTVKMPSRISDFYLVVGEDPENKILPVRMLAVDSGNSQLKPGQTLWINLTTHRIAGKLGNESLMIPPSSKAISKAPMSSNGFFKAQFLYEPAGESDFLPVMSKSWWFDAKSKNLGFIVDSGGRLPRIFTFSDQRLSGEEKPD